MPCHPHFIRSPPLIPHTEECNDKYREWPADTIDKFLRCIFGGAQYKVRALFPFVLGLSNLALYTLKGRYRFMGHRRQRDGPGTGFRKDPKQGQVLPLSLTLALSLALYLALTYPSVGLTA